MMHNARVFIILKSMIKNKIIYDRVVNWRFKMSKAKGSYVWDEFGHKMLDFTSGYNICNLGWNNEEISDAIRAQLKKNSSATFWTPDDIQERYADLLIKSLPNGFAAIGRAPSGTEANEEAIKSARAFTKRKKIIGFKDTYHGQSFGTLALGSSPEYVKSITPLVGGYIQIDFPKTSKKTLDHKKLLHKFAQNLENKLKNEDIAAIVCEAGVITGPGSTQVAPVGFMKTVRKLTKKYGTLFILDEVGTGFSRLGKLFALEIENVSPDIVTFAKASANGVMPIGTMVTSKKIAEAALNDAILCTSFGWLPLACAAALKTLEIHRRDKVWEKAKKDGDYLKKKLQQELKNYPYFQDLKGIGLEIGLELVNNNLPKIKGGSLVEKITDKARRNELFITCNRADTIQLMPNLVMERKDLDKGIDILLETIKSFK
jgi:4-aminobutyrate aminotransferase-like enzyme